MPDLRFEWDATKAAKNSRQHRVTFQEAATVWRDGSRIDEYDLRHSDEHEVRYALLGLSTKLRVLKVIYTERHEAIRIISAFKATRQEQRRYQRQG